MGRELVYEQDFMKRARGMPHSPDVPTRGEYGSRSEPGGPPQSRYDGDAELGGGRPDVKRAVSAYSDQNLYSGYAKADFMQSTINLATCVLGAGALGYPFW